MYSTPHPLLPVPGLILRFIPSMGLPASPPQVSRASLCLLELSPHNLQGVTCASMSHTAPIQAPGGARQKKVDVMFKRERALKWSLGLRLLRFHWG